MVVSPSELHDLRDRSRETLDRDSDSEEDDVTSLRKSILHRILEIQTAGSFATSGTFKEFVHPGLLVDGIGMIRLPLSSGDAQSLIGASRQAPFGKGNQTLVDETVRKTWEIDGSKVTFSNNAWHSWLDGVVGTVATNLGVAVGPEGVRADLYKMLLYEKGALFKLHKDTEKTPGMFGTLVICLPSEHVGGAVCVRHGQEKNTFSTADNSAFNVTYIAWYADVPHEVECVESGYRWVLTYNLVNTSSTIPETAARLDAQTSQLVQALALWRSLDPQPQCLCYALAHKYTSAARKLANLKGRDYFRARCIADASRKAGDFDVFLASMQNTVTMLNEGGEEESDSELHIEYIADLEGILLQYSLYISEDFLLQPSLYDSRDDYEQSGGEYLGNSHADLERVYHDTVMLIVPKTQTADFLLGQNPGLDSIKLFLERLRQYLKIKDHDQHTVRELIVQTCRNHERLKYQDPDVNDMFLGQIAMAAMCIGDEHRFRESILAVTNGFDRKTFFVLGELTCFPEPVIPAKYLVEAFSKFRKVYQTYRSLQSFRSGFSSNDINRHDDQETQYMTGWIRNRMFEALQSLPKACPQDAAVLMEITTEYDEKMLEDCIKPFIAQAVGDSDFVNAFVVELLSYSQSPGVDTDLVTSLFPLVRDGAASQFELAKYSSAVKNPYCTDGDYPYSSWPGCKDEKEKGRRDASVVIDLYQRLLQFDEDKARELLDRIQSQVTTLHCQELDRLFIPLLKQMMHVMDPGSRDAVEFYQAVMTAYITRVVEQEPEKPTDWSRPNEVNKCSRLSECVECAALREFLLDPQEESRSFRLLDHWHCKGPLPLTPYERDTDWSQKPPVLTLTKTLQRWKDDHSTWRRSVSEAEKTFQQFDQKELSQFLAEKYDAIIGLHMVKLSSIPTIVPEKRRWSDS